jgi:hypothetical protein
VTAAFASGFIVNLILLGVAAEAVILIVHHSRTGRGVAPIDLLVNLLAGACLLMAVRSALIQSSWERTAAWLAAALIAHIADLAQRWRS